MVVREGDLSKYPVKTVTASASTGGAIQYDCNYKEFACPYRKHSVHEAQRNTGCGYPDEWMTYEEFEPCIGPKCMAFGFIHELDTFYCKLMK